jgi:hypothetical protein
MKKLITSITLLLIIGIVVISCSKKESISNEKLTPFSALYNKGGIVHNELLSIFLDSLVKNNSKLSKKLKSIALKYPNLHKHTAEGDIAMMTMSDYDSEQFVRLRDEINTVVAEEVLPISISYLEQNGFYNDFYSAGIDNPQLLINEVVNGIYNNAAFSNDEYITQVFSDNSASFRNFIPALRSLIENEWSSSDLFLKIDALKDLYLSQTTDQTEALAIINGCETAKASFNYWNDPFNTSNWDATILSSFNSGTFTNGVATNTVTTHGGNDRGRTEIIVADAVGACVGVIEGARIGALAGPGGAMIVGMTGMILRGAHASLGDYCKSKILDWLGW